MRTHPLARIAGEGGARRASDGRVRVREASSSVPLALTPTLSRDAGEGAFMTRLDPIMLQSTR
jgi:hypothetical protein